MFSSTGCILTVDTAVTRDSEQKNQVPVDDAGPAHRCTRGSRGRAIVSVRNPKTRKRCITKVDARGQRRRGIVGAVYGASGALVNHEVHVPPSRRTAGSQAILVRHRLF